MPGYYTAIITKVTEPTLLLHLEAYVSKNKEVICVRHDPTLENSDNDDHIGCTEYPFLHWHTILSYSSKRWDNDSLLQDFKKRINNAGGLMKGQDIKFLKNFCTYLKIPPREEMYTHFHQGSTLQSTYTSISGEDIRTMKEKKKQERGEKLDEPHSIHLLQQMIEKYRANSQQELFEVIGQGEDYEILKKEFCKRSFDVNLKKAFYMQQMLQVHKPVKQLTNNYKDYGTEEHYSLEDSVELLQRWCKFQHINYEQFVRDVINTLDRKIPKKNCLYLQGESNSGKTWLMKSIMKLVTYYGEVNQGTANYTFMYQDCVNKRAIFINEPYFDQAMIEQLKIVLEGTGTFVHIKMKNDDWLPPTPVLMTSNTDVWRYAQEEKTAVLNRCHYYQKLRACEFLKEEGKRILHPKTWISIYEDLGLEEIPATEELDGFNISGAMIKFIRKAVNLMKDQHADFHMEIHDMKPNTYYDVRINAYNQSNRLPTPKQQEWQDVDFNAWGPEFTPDEEEKKRPPETPTRLPEAKKCRRRINQTPKQRQEEPQP